MDHSHVILTFGSHDLYWSAQDRTIAVRYDGKWIDSTPCRGEVLVWKVQEDGLGFVCAHYDPACRTGFITQWRDYAPHLLTIHNFPVPEGGKFMAAASPSGRSLANTFFENHKRGICVVRRTPEGPKFDELYQQCGYPFSITDTSITFELA